MGNYCFLWFTMLSLSIWLRQCPPVSLLSTYPFPIVMNKWFMTQDFEHVDTLFTNDLSFSDFSIHWWFLPKSVAIIVAVKWWFPISLIPLHLVTNIFLWRKRSHVPQLLKCLFIHSLVRVHMDPWSLSVSFLLDML